MRGPGRDGLEAVLVAAALFALYAMGASPTIYVGDSGELVAAVHTLGIPHPSGYPLYVLLGKLWTLLVPIGSVAYRMSLFSAACAALACAWLYTTCRSAGLGRPAALLAASLLALAPSFWSQANVQRVYALNAVFVVAATAAAWRWHRERRTGVLALAFFLCGLGACNHTFMGIHAFALGLFMLATEPELIVAPERALVRGAAIGGAFLAGLLPYAYLPIRSRMNPRLDWGNPESVDGFFDVLLREDFWERAWFESPADLVTVAADYVLGIGQELAWVGAALAVLGVWAGLRRGLPVLLPLLVMAGNLAAMGLHGSRSDIFIWHRYYIPSYAMAALLAGIGWQWIADSLSEKLRGPARAAQWAVLVLPAVLLLARHGEFDRSRYRLAEDFADAVLESLPPGAHLIATDDNVLFVLIYLHLVEGRRPDINLILQGVGKADLPPLRFDPENDPLFFTHHPNWNLPDLEIVPVGVVYRAARRGGPPLAAEPPRQWLDGERDERVPRDYLTQNLIGHFHYTLGFTFENRDWPRALEEFERAAQAAPGNDVLFYNLGLIFARNGWYDEAVAAFERSDKINPRHLASLSKPRASGKIEEALAERERVRAIEAGFDIAAGLAPGTPEHHLALAGMLEAEGEHLAARGHRLRTLTPARPASP